MNCRWVRYLALLALGCSESEPGACRQPDYSICGSPLGEREESGQPWLSYSQDLVEICGDATFIETSLGQCEDGKRVLSRSWGFGGDQRFYEGERLVGRMAGGDVFFVEAGSPQCICAGATFQGTLDSVHCRVTRAEALCGRSEPSWIAHVTLEFAPIELRECGCGAAARGR
jgi:hypothetical protein